MLNYGKAKIITGTNVFAHIDNLHELFNNLKKILDRKKGVFIIEVPHFMNLIKDLEYDTIYHEHLSYITVKPLKLFLSKIGLDIIKIEKKDIHGGSIRIFMSFKGNYKIHFSVKKIINEEIKMKLNDLANLKRFSNEVKKNRFAIISLLTKLKQKNKNIIGLSTPAKGMTLLNYCKLDRDYLDFATEKSNLKIGKYTPGGHIPIYNDEKILKKNLIML